MKKHLFRCYLVPFNPTSTYWGRLGVAVLLLLSLPILTFAQNKIWDKTIGGEGWDQLRVVQQTPDGGYILGGFSSSSISGDKTEKGKGQEGAYDYWVVKVNAAGNKVWDKAFGGTTNDFLTSLEQTPDGGYILGGYTDSGMGADKSAPSRGGLDYWVVKLDANGKKIWDKTFGGSGEDILRVVKPTSDGGYILGGISASNISGDKTQASKGELDYWIVKLKANGSKAWDKTIGGNKIDEFTALQQTSDGSYILGGYSTTDINGDKTEGNKGFSDYWLVKLKADGTKLWDKTIGGNSADELKSLQLTSDGGYILGGTSSSDISGDKSETIRGESDYWIVKLKADGSKEWDKNFGGHKTELFAVVQQTSDNGYLLGGTSYSSKGADKSEFRRGGEDFWVIKVNATGTKIWDKTLGSPGLSTLSSLQETSDGNIILGGSSNGAKGNDKSEDPRGEFSDDYWIVKLDSKLTNLSQDITFQPIPYKTLSDAPFKLAATATSKLPVTFSVVSGPATIQGNTVTITGLGEVTIKAFQAGNATYKPVEATRTFVVRNNIEKPWDKAFGGSARDHLTAMLNTADGDLVLGGYSASNKSGNKSQDSYGKQDYWLVKTDKAGQKLWDKTYGGNGSDFLNAVLATPDGGYLLGGTSTSSNSGTKVTANRGGSDYWVVKVDGEGNKLWEKTFGGLRRDSLTVLVASPDGNYLLGGTSNSGQGIGKSQASFGDRDFWIIKIDSVGNKVWDKTIGGDKKDELAAIIPTPNGGYLMGGTSASGISGEKSQAVRANSDYWIVRIDENGTKLWDKTYGGATYDYFEFDFGYSVLATLVATPDGGYLLGGSSTATIGAEKTEDSKAADDYTSNIKDYWVIKIDGNGNKIWDKVYTGRMDSPNDGSGSFFFTGDCTLKTIVPAGNGDYLLAGISDANKGMDKTESPRFEDPLLPERYDYWIVRIDDKGYKKWDRTIGGFNNETLTTILPLATGEYLLGGSSSSRVGGDRSQSSPDPSGNSNQRSDYWIVKMKVTEQPLTPQRDWRYHSRFGQEGFTSVIKTADDGYLSGGYSNGGVSSIKSQASQGKHDFWIVKSDKEGQKLWDKRYGGTEDDYLNRIILTKDGGYLLAGSSLSGKNGDKTESSRGNRDYWIVKVDKDGTKQWDKRYGGSGYDELKKVIQLSTGEYILAGYSNSPVGGDKTQDSQGGWDFWIVKISATGAVIWDKRYGGTLNEELGGIVSTSNGGFLLGGSSLSGKNGDKSEAGRGSSDFWVISVDKNGNKLWDKTYGGTGNDAAYSLGRGGNNTYFIAGQSDSPAGLDKTAGSQGSKDFWLLKLDDKGAKVWDKTFGGSKDEELRASIYTQDGGYLLAGRSFSGKSGDKSQDSQGGSDYWIVKTNADGKYEWDKRFGGSKDEELRAIIQTTDGGYLLGGRSDSDISGDVSQPGGGTEGTDYWLIKTAPEKASSLVARQATTFPAEAATHLPQELPLQAYPNPFREKVNVSFTLPQTEAATVKIFDGQGQEIITLFNSEAKANQNYQVEWQAGSKPAGLYFLQLQTPTLRQQQKLLLTK